MIKLDPTLLEKKKLLCSVSGVGEKIATTLIIFLPELGLRNRRQITSLCGLAPFNNENGTYQGHRYIKGGDLVFTPLFLWQPWVQFDATIVVHPCILKWSMKNIALRKSPSLRLFENWSVISIHS